MQPETSVKKPRKGSPEAISASAKSRMLEARTALVLDEPFWGMLAMRLKLVEDWSCDTMWTDGISLGYNPVFTNEISPHEVKGTVVHEVVHVAMKHPWRRENRDREIWNEACDYSANPLIDAAGYILPGGVLRNPAYKGKAAEEIYFIIFRDKPQSAPQQGQGNDQNGNGAGNQSQQGQGAPDPGNNPSQQGNGSGQGKGKGKGKGSSAGGAPSGASGQGPSQGQGTGQGTGQGGSGTPDTSSSKPKYAGEVRDPPKGTDIAALDNQWTVAIDQVARLVETRYGALPGFVEGLVGISKKQQIDWTEVVAAFLQRSFNNLEYRWTQLSKPYLIQGLMMPSLVGTQLPPVVFAKDTSGSVYSELIAMFNETLRSLLEDIRPERIYELQADTRITHIRELEPGDEMTPAAKGRGGTNFRPVFDWVENEGINPACLIYASDLDGPFPEEEPPYPVLWVVPYGCPLDPPWGVKLELPFPGQ